MRCLRYLPLPLSLLSSLLPTLASAEPWVAQPGFFTENAKLGSSMVDAADLNGDGYIDLVFANGGGYDKGDMLSDLPQQAFRNEAGAATTDISLEVFGPGASFNGRAVKIRDIDRDGDNDIMLGVTWQKQSQLYLNSDGLGTFINETDSNLPQLDASIGDLELGDVDGDGDLDMVLADWGPDAPVGDPVSTEGGTTMLWLQDGTPAAFNEPSTGVFSNATLANMPLDKIRWAWDLEFVNVDNDFDLDVAISCFACTKQSLLLFANDGAGKFTNVTADNVAQGLGAFDVEPIDLNNDTFLDFVTLRDGTGGRNRILINDKMGGFDDKSDLVWPKLENPASFDHMAAFLDYNSDGKPDIAIGAFNPGKVYPDRLIENQNGVFKQNTFAFNAATPATYALVLADFNKDHRLDVAQAQNENAFDKRVFIGDEVELPVDTAPPVIGNHEELAGDIEFGLDHTLRLRVHDNKSPLMLHDFQSPMDGQDGRPYIESWTEDPGPDPMGGDVSNPGEWYGEYLWRVTFNVPKSNAQFCYRACAIDAAANKACSLVNCVDNPDDSTTTGDTTGPVDPTSGGTSAAPTTSGTGDTAGMCNDDGICDEHEKDDPSCGDCCDNDGICEPPNEDKAWCDDCNPDTPTIDFTTGSVTSATDTLGGTESAGQLDDDGCGCDVNESPTQGMIASLALLGLLAIRRRRQS